MKAKFIASEASIHSLRAEAAKLARTNKAKFYLHSVSRKKFHYYIPPSPVNPCSNSSKMYMLVGNMILYVFLQKNGKFGAPFLLNNVNIGRRVHPITRAVGNSDAGKASPPLPAVLNINC